MNILLIEYDHSTRETFKMALVGPHINRVEVVPDFDSALPLLQQYKFDFILIDCCVHNFDDCDKFMKSIINIDSKIVLMTSYFNIDYIKSRFNNHCVLSKPFPLEDLENILNNC